MGNLGTSDFWRLTPYYLASAVSIFLSASYETPTLWKYSNKSLKYFYKKKNYQLGFNLNYYILCVIIAKASKYNHLRL